MSDCKSSLVRVDRIDSVQKVSLVGGFLGLVLLIEGVKVELDYKTESARDRDWIVLFEKSCPDFKKYE